MPMRISKLKHLVEIQSGALTGEVTARTTVWTTFATAWAAITPLKGEEVAKHQTIEAKVDHKFEMRYLAGVTREHRIKYGTRVFNIHAVLNLKEENREMLIEASEVV